MRRLLLAAAAVTVLVTGAAVTSAPALAAGTGGIEVTPIPSFDASGKLLTSFHLTPSDGHAKGAFELRNLTGSPDTAKLYGAQATAGADGAIAIGDAASGAWLGIPATTITLAPHATRRFDFTATTSAAHTLGAVVIEDTHGTIVTRAATLVTIEGTAGLTAAGVATWIACVAGGLAVFVGGGNLLLFIGRRRRREPARPDVPARELASV